MATNVDITKDAIPGTVRDGTSGVLLVINADGSINTTGSAGTASTASNIVQVAGAAIAQGHGTAATAIRVELPTDGTGVVGLSAGTAVIGKAGIDQTTPGTTNAVQDIAGTAGGALVLSTLVTNSTTAVVVKNSPGQIYGIEAFNNGTVIAYLKIYDATSATAGAGTPVARYLIPAPASGGGGFAVNSSVGRQYSTGITYTVVLGFADNDATAPAASSYFVNIHYK